MPEPGGGSRSFLRSISPEVILQLWAMTFDVGDEHDSREVRDEGSVPAMSDYIRSSPDEEDIRDVAAGALFRIVTWHPFWDCNHRTGWLVANMILEFFEYDRRVPPDEAIGFVRSIDRDGVTEEQVRAWIHRKFPAS